MTELCGHGGISLVREQNTVTKERRKRGVLYPVLGVVILVIVMLVAVFLVLDEKRQSVKEWSKFGDLNDELGKVYRLRDVPIQTDSIIILEVDTDYRMDETRPVGLTRVIFQSKPTDQLFFLGDRTKEFTEGKEVDFDLAVKSYDTVQWGRITCTELGYTLTLMQEYFLSIEFDKSDLIEFTVESIGNDEYKLTVEDVAELYPLPDNWMNVTVVIALSENLGAIDLTVELYDANDALIGILEDIADSDLLSEMVSGQYLVFTYNPVTDGELELILGVKNRLTGPNDVPIAEIAIS